MRIVLLLSLTVFAAHVHAQTPPATAAPAQSRATRPATRTTLVITATDPTGATLPGVRVEVLGASDRAGETDESGTLRLTNLRPGTYRLRFTGADVITYERETVVRAGQVADVDVMLNPAPEDAGQPAPQPPPEPLPAAPQVGPRGEPKNVSILDLLEKDFIGRQQRKETPLGCSGNARATMIQLNEELPERLYEGAESVYYVLGGEGTLRLEGRESAVVTGGFVLVPRGASHAFIRKGRRPLILLAVLSGEPCQSTP